MEVVAVERELGSGQGDIMTRFFIIYYLLFIIYYLLLRYSVLSGGANLSGRL